MNDINVNIDICSDINKANEIRKYLMGSIETLSIDQIYVLENSSILSDEYMANRLALIVIDCSDLSDNELNNNYTFRLKVPTVKEETYVTSSMIVFNDKRIKCCNKNTIITKLNYDCELDIWGTISKGTARNHSKWSAISGMSMTFENGKYVLNFDLIGNVPKNKLLNLCEEKLLKLDME